MGWFRASTPGSPLIVRGVALLVWVHRHSQRGDTDPSDRVEASLAGLFMVGVGILQICRNGW
jgi:hypothetical protein